MKHVKKTKKNNSTFVPTVVGADDIEGCLKSIAWTHRALGSGLVILGMTNAELKAALRDEERFYLIGQFFKMLLIDQKYAEFQAYMRSLAIERITHALVERNHPATEHLIKSDIDFAIVPDAPGLSAATINAVRPSKTH